MHKVGWNIWCEYSGNNFKFYPDAAMTGSLQVASLNELFYTDIDLFNAYPVNEYGDVKQSFDVAFYNATNGNRINKTEFIARTDGIPIFEKTFNPTDSTQLNLSTGVFTIDNHFFRTGGSIIYSKVNFCWSRINLPTYGSGTPSLSIVSCN